MLLRRIFPYPETVAETEKITAKKLIEERIVGIVVYGRGEIRSNIGWDQTSDQRAK